MTTPKRTCSATDCERQVYAKGICTKHYMRLRTTGRLELAPRPSPSERVWSKVNVAGPDDCWEWQAYRDESGYGHVRSREHGPELAHRAVWRLTNGAIPDGLWVLHSCDNPPCCNPAHLRLGTHAENVADRVARNRSRPLRGSLNPRAKLTEDAVREIRERYANGERQRPLAREFGITYAHISQIVSSRKRWSHVRCEGDEATAA